MKSVIKKNIFNFTINQSFTEVIKACKKITRKDQNGTWITDDIQEAYTELYKKGIAHSAEAWQNGELVGGLYGVRLGNIFFGESMFSKTSNAKQIRIHQLRRTINKRRR